MRATGERAAGVAYTCEEIASRYTRAKLPFNHTSFITMAFCISSTPQRIALFLMDDTTHTSVYGSSELAELRGLMRFEAPVLFTADSLAASAADLSRVEAIFSGRGVPPLTDELLDRFPACRIVFHAGGAARSFATNAFWSRGVRLTTAASVNAITVAEYTLAAIIFSLKHAWQRLLELREKRVGCRMDAAMPGAFGSTVGLLSLSRVGRLVAGRLRALDVRVIAYDPVVDRAEAEGLGVELVSLAEVFACSDVVSCHLPLWPDTVGCVRAAHFAGMKPGATFINTARRAVVNQLEMIAVLRERPDLFAVLDVVQHEPVTPEAPVLTLPNVLVTPHIAGSLGLECRRMGRFMVHEARRYLKNEPLFGEVLPAQLAFK